VEYGDLLGTHFKKVWGGQRGLGSQGVDGSFFLWAHGGKVSGKKPKVGGEKRKLWEEKKSEENKSQLIEVGKKEKEQKNRRIRSVMGA